MRILLGTDGSRYAGHAATYLRSCLASTPSARIDITAVVPAPSSVPPESARRHAQTVPTREHAERWTTEAAALFENLAGPVHTLVVQGDPAETLVDRSAEYDLVVIGVKGRGAAPFFELGSTALSVIRHAQAPVLLVRPPRSRAGLRSALETSENGSLRVLLSSEVDDASLVTSNDLLRRLALPRAAVEVVSVLEAGSVDPGRTGRARWAGISRGEVRRRASGWLETVIRDMAPHHEGSKGIILEGEPAREIARRAVSAEADLIVMGTRCPEAAPGAPLGRTARELAWSAPCSVLLVRSKALVPAKSVQPAET